MEGTACYRYSKVARYLKDTGGEPVRTVVDVGANLGEVTRDLLLTFPEATIHAFEVVPSLVDHLRKRFVGISRLKIRHAAIHAACDAPLCVWEAVSDAGIGWRGGSKVAQRGQALDPRYYVPCGEVPVVSLDDLVDEFGQIDFLKTDCEGSEISFLGAASKNTLAKVRWIGGEYHHLDRWWPVQQRLAETHRCNLLAEEKHARQLGSFFLERIDESPGLVNRDSIPPRVYSWGLAETICWHRMQGAYA